MSCAYNRRSKLMLSVNCSTRRSVAWLKTPDHAFFATKTPRVATALDPLKRNNTFSVNGLRQRVNDRPGKAARSARGNHWPAA